MRFLGTNTALHAKRLITYTIDDAEHCAIAGNNDPDCPAMTSNSPKPGKDKNSMKGRKD